MNDTGNTLPTESILFLDFGTWDDGPEDPWSAPETHTRFYFAFNADRGTRQTPSVGTFVGTVCSPNKSRRRVQKRLERMGCIDVDVSTSPQFLAVMREIVQFVDAVTGKIIE